MIVYAPIFNNGEPWEDNKTYMLDVVFVSKNDCIKWIENITAEDGSKYSYNGLSSRWELRIDKYNPYGSKIQHPFGTYRIKEINLVE